MSGIQDDAACLRAAARYAIASRLSFMLVGSPPDRELRELAAAGNLRDPKVLDAQVDRLLADPRSDAFFRPLVTQWLNLNQPVTLTMSSLKKQDSRFGRHLKDSTKEETIQYVARLFADNRPARELVASDWTMMNDILAVHYGYPSIDGGKLRKLPMQSRPDDPRGGGVLGHAGIQSMLSWMGDNWMLYCGSWALTHILDDPPPPPPLEVPELLPLDKANQGKSFRELLVQHQADSQCSVCHKKMDPLGFAFQNFDLSGRWRNVEHERYHRAELDGKIEWRGEGKSRPVDTAGQTRWPSMVVGADGGQYTCSFKTEGRPVLADFDLASIFAELVGADPKGRMPQRSSILDLVADQAASLRRELGKSDERKLDEYVESIRAVEKRVQADIAWKSTFRREAIQDDRLNLRADPHNTPDGVDFVDTMLELIYLALRIDCTRVAAFSAYRSSQCCVLKHLGFDVHAEGHSSGDALPEDKPKQFTNLSKADAWWTERLARFLDRLRTTREGEHDMLRHTTVMYGSGMSWPAYHRNHNLPILLAGGESVGFAHGRHIAFNGQKKDIPSDKHEHRNATKLGPDAVSMSDLLRTVSERMGVPAEGFGESRRVLDELLT